MPHALIATFGGNTAEATLAYSKMYPNQPCISLVDFNNNCPKTALEVADAMRKEGRILNGVRLDTSENMVDESLWGDMHNFKPTGVCIELVRKTRNMLDVNGHGSVKIYVSGGFSPEKVKAFEDARAPVDGYGVGSSMFDDKIDFTADIVKIERNGKWMPCAKVGRKERPNPRLKPRKLRN